MDSLALVRELVALPGPPGQEETVSQAVARHTQTLNCHSELDERGNLLISLPGASCLPDQADILVMAHLDEIALLVVKIEPDGRLIVTNMGGVFPWKWGEGPVLILASPEPLTGVLSFGSIHTNSPDSSANKAKDAALRWEMTHIFTGLSAEDLAARGVRPGTRVVLHPSRRIVTEFADFFAAPFLDDRADLAALLLALESIGASERFPRTSPHAKNLLFAATAAEEVGGHGALWLLQKYRPSVAIALEIGPHVPESRISIDAQPTVWVNDSYSAMQTKDLDLVAAAAEEAGLTPHWQALSRGGSDASCAASHGLTARPITLAFAAENSHGYEIMHREALPNLAKLLVAVLHRLIKPAGPKAP